jgi:GTP cyclohydrolase IA
MIKKIKSNENIIRSTSDRDEMLLDATKYYGKFLDSLGFDWKHDPNMMDTPNRVAKMFIDELYAGSFNAPPNITAFDNVDGYDGMVFQGNIKMQSTCSHHAVPFVGVAHIAYIPSADGKIIGLSKLNRIVEYYARRPQVQENLTMQIHSHVDQMCEGNIGVAVMIEANHMCVQVRGVEHDSIMKTTKLSKRFLTEDKVLNELYQFINGQ